MTIYILICRMSRCKSRGPWIALEPEFVLMPLRIRLRQRTDVVQPCRFLRCEPPLRGSENVLQLLFVPRAKDHGVDARFVKNPVDRHLRDRDTARQGDEFEHV